MSHLSCQVNRHGVPLMERNIAGILVALLYARRTDEVFVLYSNAQTSEEFVIAVPKRHALDAYKHPIAYRDSIKSAQEISAYLPSRSPLSSTERLGQAAANA